MLSFQLLNALCESGAEDVHFCTRNVKGSLDRMMKSIYWSKRCYGKPEECGVYLMADALLENVAPDLIYSLKGKTFESTVFGYRIEDAPAFFGV